MMQVGVTGGIGSGKSTVCKIFNALGIPVYDADNRAKKIMQDNKELVNSIKAAFGKESYLSDGSINRDFLAKSVFSTPQNTELINSLVHPAVAIDYSQWTQKQDTKYVIKEAALLIESSSYKQLDKLVVVSAPVELRIDRIKSRDPFRTEDEIRRIIDKQLSDQEREEKADYILKNDESELLVDQVLKLDRLFRA